MRTLSRSSSQRTGSSMLTGFIRLDHVPTKDAAGLTQWLTPTDKWVYALLSRETLHCYTRRADIKLNRAPRRVVLLDLDATRVGEKQSLLVQSRATGKTFRLRVHASSSSTFLQWVTALYLARLHASGSNREEREIRRRSKRVTFKEETSEVAAGSTATTSDDDQEKNEEREEEEEEESAALYYTRDDLEGFRQSHLQSRRNAKKPLAVGRRMVRTLVARLRRRSSIDDDDDEGDD